MDELLPCPFCGEDARLSKTMDESLWSHATVPYYKVACGECEISTGYVCEGEEFSAIDRWNRRAAAALTSQEPHR